MSVSQFRSLHVKKDFAPLVVNDVEMHQWDLVTDALVVGFGIAGACCALELAEAGLSVTVLDRFEGGGASALSGGVYYGGGTRYQKEAGFEDNASEMFHYLKKQTDGAVDDDVLRRFCEESNENLLWLEQHGVSFSGAFYEEKTSYPPEGYYLYFSGNERLPEYSREARPAPRGHKVYGKGLTGGVLWSALHASAKSAGIDLLWQSRVRRIVVDCTGVVIGVKATAMNRRSLAARIHRFAMRRFNASLMRMTGGPVATATGLILRLIERLFGKPLWIRARYGVVLATGGYVYNRVMVKDVSPRYSRALPLGTLGCDGSGICMAEGAGAAIKEIGNMDASRLIAPPPSYLQGILIDSGGERFIAEDAYTATIGRAVNQRPDGRAFLVIPKQLRSDIWHFFRKPANMLEALWILRMFTSSYLAARSGSTLHDISLRCGIDPVKLDKTIKDYAESVRLGVDALGKASEHLRDLGTGPFLAIDVSSDSIWNPATTFSLGGIDVDEETGQARTASQRPIQGLYAAGRAAFGIPSRSYVSGLSIADCVFSGRRVGNALAATALKVRLLGMPTA